MRFIHLAHVVPIQTWSTDFKWNRIIYSITWWKGKIKEFSSCHLTASSVQKRKKKELKYIERSATRYYAEEVYGGGKISHPEIGHISKLSPDMVFEWEKHPRDFLIKQKARCSIGVNGVIRSHWNGEIRVKVSWLIRFLKRERLRVNGIQKVGECSTVLQSEWKVKIERREYDT